MKNLIRTLMLSAAALAALVTAPTSNAQGFRHGGGARETRSFRGETFRGNGFRGGESRGVRGGESRGFRGGEFRGREFRGNEFRGRGFVRPAFFGRRSFAPFRVFGGFRFFSVCPGPDYVYVDDCGWILPPFAGALWVPRFDRFGVRIGGFWR